MVDFSNISDFIFGGNSSQRNQPSIDDARITAIGSRSLSLRTPDTTAQGRFQSNALGRLLGDAPFDAKTNPTALNFDTDFKRNDDGTLEIDFTRFGGEKFVGTEQELSNVQGRDLFKLVGGSVFDANSSNSLGLQDVQGVAPIATNGSIKPIDTVKATPITQATASSTANLAASTPSSATSQSASGSSKLLSGGTSGGSVDINAGANPTPLTLDDLNNETVLALPDNLKIALLDSILSGEIATRAGGK